MKPIKRIFFVVSAVAISLFISSGSSISGNLIPNGSFEEGDNTPSGGWVLTTKGDGSGEWDSSVAHSGKKSLKLSMKGSGEGVWMRKWVRFSRNKEYRLSFWAMTSDNYNGKALVFLNVRDTNGKWCDYTPLKIPAGNRDWTYYERKVVPKANWVSIYRTYFKYPHKLGTTQGTVWIDDLTFEEIGEKAAVSSPVTKKKEERTGNLITNSGFEEVVDGKPKGWGIWAKAGKPIFSVDNETKHSGNYSAKIECPDAGRGSWSQEIPVVGGEKYRFKCWVKTEGVKGIKDGPATTIFFRWSPPARQQILAGYNMEGTKDWKFLMKDITVPDNAEKLSLHLHIYWSAGKIWFDDVELIHTGGEAKAPVKKTGAFAPVVQTMHDEFNKKELSEFWAWDEGDVSGSSYTLNKSSGFLTLIAPAGAGMWAKNFKSPKVLARVKKNFIFTTKLTDYLPKGEWEEAGILLWRDKDNWVKLERTFTGKNHELNCAGKINGKLFYPTPVRYKETEVWFKVSCYEKAIVYQYSKDGKLYRTIGKSEKFPVKKAGFYAANGPTEAKFDFA